MTITHDLKCWPDAFAALWARVKRAEFRKDDRGFAVGDLLRFREWSPEAAYTGRAVLALVTHRQEGYGIPQGFVMLSIEEVARREHD
jgi:hypothetical protein